MLTDPIADMLSRIRNANRAMHDHVEMPSSRTKEQIARLLKEEGYIREYHIETAETWNASHPNKKDHRSYNTLVIELKFGRNRERVITNLKRVSKPGRRIYARKDRMPRVLGGMGVAILSTSNGLVTGKTAQQQGVGGEVVAFIW
jgi:small subunit ribosomal protein S8